MFDVIEHLDDPFIFMQKLNGSLKKVVNSSLQHLIWTHYFKNYGKKLSLDNAYAQILFFRKKHLVIILIKMI